MKNKQQKQQRSSSSSFRKDKEGGFKAMTKYNNNKNNDRVKMNDNNMKKKKYDQNKTKSFNKKDSNLNDHSDVDDHDDHDEEEDFETVPADDVDSALKQKRRKNHQELDNDYDEDDAEFDNEEDEEQEEEDGDNEEDGKAISKSLRQANKKHKKTGGFQSMGLSYPVYSGIIHKGFKIPTPIQRKSIPVILEGKDVVAMARTGSGKTAAFVIPLLEKLKSHSAKVGARGLILTPGRELALQTLKFLKELGKHMDLRAVMLVGGDSMDEQFAAIATNPDIIIATPGRLMHLIIEANLDLRTIEYVVFDEADRLFEMGFEEQLREILFKLPESRQTLLFSATLPKLLVDFAKAGLSDPALIRLDVDTKISPDLQMMFFSIKNEDKEASLLYLLQSVIPKQEQTIIFVATKHLVEYLHELLLKAGIDNTYIFGSLDQVARKIHIARFRAGDVKVLVVTDVAARGIDIPMLDNVINYDFPPSPKVMIHRVGRVGRAGRKGIAFSLLSSDEMPFMIDFQVFTGRPLIYSAVYHKPGNTIVPNYTNEIIIGTLPPSALDMEREQIVLWLRDDATLHALLQSVKNGYRMYHKTRGLAAKDSYSKAKEMLESTLGVHPYLVQAMEGGKGQVELQRASFLDELSKFRPPETIFEVGRRGYKANESVLMQTRRRQLASSIEARKSKTAETHSNVVASQQSALGTASNSVANTTVDEAELQASFKQIGGASKKRKRTSEATTEDGSFRDTVFYMSHFPKDAATERGLAVNAATTRSTLNLPDTFAERAGEVALDLAGDDEEGLLRGKKKGNLIWDKKHRRFVREAVGGDNKKRMKSESGASIPASFKSNRFEQWQKRTKINIPKVGEQELASTSLGVAGGGRAFGQRTYRYNTVTEANPKSKNFARKQAAVERAERLGFGKKSGGGGGGVSNTISSSAAAAPKAAVRKQQQGNRKGGRSELKNAKEIAKQRMLKERRREKTGRHKPKAGGGGGGGRGGGSSKKRR